MDGLAVNNGSGVTLSAELLEEVDELTLLLVNDLSENLESGALFELHDLVNNLLRSLLDDSFATVGTVRDTDSRPEQTQIVVNLGNCSNR